MDQIEIIKPWGSYKVLYRSDNSWIKILTLKPLQRFSLQTHEYRDEYWTIMSGQGLASVDEENAYVDKGQTVYIPKQTKHRLYNISKDIDLVVCEVALGQCDENDIERLEDDYNR